MPQNTYPADPTIVVAIIGDGKRDEVLINRAQGEGLDGQPVDYDINNQPDGRYYKLNAYPVVPGSIEVIKKTRNRISQPTNKGDIIQPLFTNDEFGYVVLKYPLDPGEQLIVKYITTFDKNNPRLFTAEELPAMYALYGSQSLENTISVGATIAFLNGASHVLGVLGNDLNIDPTWSETYSILEKETPYYVVPLPPQKVNDQGVSIPEPKYGISPYSDVVASGLKTVEKMSSTSERNESVLVVGETNNLTVEEAKILLGQSERAIFAAPKTTQYFIDGQLQTLDGRFLAPALAGILAKTKHTYGAMNKQGLGVIVQGQFKKSAVELRRLVTDGVSYFMPARSGVKLNRAITTSQSKNSIFEEPSVLRIKDYLINTFRVKIQQKHVGNTIQLNIEKEIKVDTINFLERQINNRFITTYNNILVKQDKVEPRQMNISFDFEPIFPLIFINVSFNVQLL